MSGSAFPLPRAHAAYRRRGARGLEAGSARRRRPKHLGLLALETVATLLEQVAEVLDADRMRPRGDRGPRRRTHDLRGIIA